MYAMAHDYVYGSKIEQGVIMVCTPDLYYQEFKVEGLALRQWKHAFLKRLDMYNELMHDEKEKAKVDLKENNTAHVSLAIPEDGISPGQACVFYSKDQFGHKVLGGGWIKE